MSKQKRTSAAAMAKRLEFIFLAQAFQHGGVSVGDFDKLRGFFFGELVGVLFKNFLRKNGFGAV